MLEKSIAELKKIRISELETSSKVPLYLLHYGKNHYEVSKTIANFVSILQQVNSIAEAITMFEEEENKSYTEEELRQIINKYLCPIFHESNTKSSPFLVKKDILSSCTIGYFSNILKQLFNKKIIISLMMIVFVLEIVFFKNNWSLVTLSGFNLYTILGVLLLFVCSSLVHEIGHAAACKYFGVEHGGVGVGLYLNFPVFYTNVSNVWMLSRKQRIVVNFAGVYFQLILLIPVLMFYFYTCSDLLKYFIFIVNLNCLITLNPFFKFDGYWIMSDLLGVPNLRKRTMELVNYYLKKWMKRSYVMRKPFLLGMRMKEKIFMYIYTVIVNVFFVYYFFYILPSFMYDFMVTFPSYAKSFFMEIGAGKIPDYQLFQIVILKLLFFVFIVYFLVKLLNKGIYNFRKIVLNTENKYSKLV